VRNSPLLPGVALVLAVALALAAISANPGQLIPLTELQLGALGGALAFAVFGVQGLISVLLEGRELRPGAAAPQLTNPLSAAIVVVSLLLFADAVFLGYGIVTGWDTARLGVAAGAGCVFLAALLIFYKEAFLGDEARFDDREDGIPW
jgi:nitroreductase